MIWMGVGRPEDFVAPLNRFPVHNQRVMTSSNGRLVANFDRIPVVMDVSYLLVF